MQVVAWAQPGVEGSTTYSTTLGMVGLLPTPGVILLTLTLTLTLTTKLAGSLSDLSCPADKYFGE